MALGINDPAAPLWKLRMKVNTPDGGLNFTLHCAEKSEADAKAIFLDIGARYRAILPSVCEVYYAVMSKDSVKKDGRALGAIIGDGLYGQGGVDPAPTTYNRYDDCFNIRVENDEGGWLTWKHGPIPDTEIVAGEMAHVPTPVSGIPAGVVPATGAQPVTFATELNNLMATIVKFCHHVQTKNHTPGGNYTWFPFKNAIAMRVGKKKGGRVSTK